MTNIENSDRDPTAKCGVWTIHSEIESRPMLRGFAKTRAEAETQMGELKKVDPEPEYWLIELTWGELRDFRDHGMLPAGY